MDDFGTGYSSLSYLSRLPVDILKMDRSFLGGGIDDNGLAAAIMAIGDRLGLEVVAEGIERQDQISSLQSLGFEPRPRLPLRPPDAARLARRVPRYPHDDDRPAARPGCSITSRDSTARAASPGSVCFAR